ncbi:hypothetical protein HPB47_000167 [Ixodes persulcatus]|uniref:Uncharacterized protein n=1 Tax=Ixodes persulcatus TaxID=34615 RepID=A0AC60PSK3_IXOPE|nr:hypothetical protein HPB47_000167 [Ixodes persulcatus]
MVFPDDDDSHSTIDAPATTDRLGTSSGDPEDVASQAQGPVAVPALASAEEVEARSKEARIKEGKTRAGETWANDVETRTSKPETEAEARANKEKARVNEAKARAMATRKCWMGGWGEEVEDDVEKDDGGRERPRAEPYIQAEGSAGPTRSARVTAAQKEEQLSFITEHPLLARHVTDLSSALTRDEKQRLWEQLARRLNALGPPTKSSKQWKEHWSRRVMKARKRAAVLNEAARRTGGGSSTVCPLASSMARILTLVGADSAFGAPGVRVPAEPDDQQERSSSSRHQMAAEPVPSTSRAERTVERKQAPLQPLLC